MLLNGLMGWANALQLLVAGFALMLCAQQLAVARWEGRESSATAVARVSAAIAIVLGFNAALLGTIPSGLTTFLLLGRMLSLAALTLSIPPLAARLGPTTVPRWLTRALVVTVIGRVVLWPTTHLVFAHRTKHGFPVYGPLTAPTAVVLLVLLFGYLVHVALATPRPKERFVLISGVLGSIGLAGASLAVASPFAGEVLTGYMTLPSLAAVTVLVWRRQVHAQYAVRRLADRQRALATISRLALDEPMDKVRAAASAAVADAELVADREFVAAVNNVVGAAAAAQQATADLKRKATTDELTGLPNRSQTTLLIQRALDRRHLERSTVAVAVCNLDRFTTVNDAFGHDVGDQVLRQVSHRLEMAASSCDVVGRVGGDEFAFVCSDCEGSDSVDELVTRVHSALQHVTADGSPLFITASLGVSVASDDGTFVTGEACLRDALTAMHDAKSQGIATRRFQPELRQAVIYRADVERQLVGAVGRGEIEVHYQPIVALPEGNTVGFEALARWRRAGVLVAPADWITVAEGTGLIHEIGNHVLDTAVTQTAAWRSQGHDVSVNVNVSARQLADRRLAHAVLEARRRIPSAALVVEVTESLALDCLAHQTLGTMQRLGVRTSLDDFGTGYSALAAIARLPIDEIKIDREIISRITHRDGSALVEAALTVARTLGVVVLAEGVETEEQHHVLLRLGCERAQGFLYSAPLAAEEATAWLTSRQPVTVAVGCGC